MLILSPLFQSLKKTNLPWFQFILQTLFVFFFIAKALYICVHAHLPQLYLTLETLWTVACQAPLPIVFPRKENWSGLLFPSPGDLPNPGVKSLSTVTSTLQVDSLPLSYLGSVYIYIHTYTYICTLSISNCSLSISNCTISILTGNYVSWLGTI